MQKTMIVIDQRILLREITFVMEWSVDMSIILNLIVLPIMALFYAIYDMWLRSQRGRWANGERISLYNVASEGAVTCSRCVTGL